MEFERWGVVVQSAIPGIVPLRPLRVPLTEETLDKLLFCGTHYVQKDYFNHKVQTGAGVMVTYILFLSWAYRKKET